MKKSLVAIYPNLLPFFFLFFSWIPLHAVTIHVHNDSAYTLHAKIYSANDNEVSSMVVTPRNTITWQDSFFDARDYTTGPFSVVFTCPNGDEYGTVTNLSENSTARARAARGPKQCRSEDQPEFHRDYDQMQPHAK